MPEPVNAFSIFVMLMSMGTFAWRENYGMALWFFMIASFLIYLEYWKYSKSKLEK